MRQSYLCRIRRCLNCGGNDSARSAVACEILPVAEMAEPGCRNKPVTRSQQRDFQDFLGRLCRAKDKAEFDQFMTERRSGQERPQA